MDYYDYQTKSTFIVRSQILPVRLDNQDMKFNQCGGFDNQGIVRSNLQWKMASTDKTQIYHGRCGTKRQTLIYRGDLVNKT